MINYIATLDNKNKKKKTERNHHHEHALFLFSYHQRDNMRIALNIDVSLLLSQLVFFIGLSTGDNLVRKFILFT